VIAVCLWLQQLHYHNGGSTAETNEYIGHAKKLSIRSVADRLAHHWLYVKLALSYVIVCQFLLGYD